MEDHIKNQKTEEEIRRERMERSKRLAELFPDDPQGVSSEATTTHIVSTTAARFSRWLRGKTSRVAWRKFTTDRGYFTIDRVWVGDSQKDTTVLRVNGMFWFSEKEGGGAIIQDDLMSFTLYHLAGGRIAVQARCNQPAVADYYRQLLADIAKGRV